jgi:dTDP-glucose 4,6-dehydratase
MAELLVTGGAGFIGSNFVRYWRERHPADAIVVLDVLSYAGDRANLAGIPAIEFVEGDIRDFELVSRLLERHCIDTLVHFAAESHVDRSIHGPDAFIDTNIVGTHALLKAAKAFWLDPARPRAHRFHHVSTDEVFGSLADDDPLGAYGVPLRRARCGVRPGSGARAPLPRRTGGSRAADAIAGSVRDGPPGA